ncbi:hypothetical protein LK08_27325 [Streptomyces sp. MUSC 125]|uniref:hypothetical protein n=1 Tax=Streptomyces sp. MUSC 125 TaxID=1428624 RepID=UPI0005801EAE|nr:hypothetical protein [Streptomyces sp. MUSC 125]KIE23943.1 hypothetical protein LK08_27325 [Streptomyces sp. MUSC 125]
MSTTADPADNAFDGGAPTPRADAPHPDNDRTDAAASRFAEPDDGAARTAFGEPPDGGEGGAARRPDGDRDSGAAPEAQDGRDERDTRYDQEETGRPGPSRPRDPSRAQEQPPRTAQDDDDNAPEPLSHERFDFIVGQSSRNASVYGGHGNVAVAFNLSTGAVRATAEFQQTPLGARDTAWRHRLYQRPPGLDRLASGLADTHLAVLLGQRGSGRDTTARVALADACGGSDRLSVLHSAGTGLAQALVERADQHLTRGHGVILDLGTEEPGPAVLEALSLRARERGAYVGLIVESTGADAQPPYAFRHPRPALKKVLEAHLRWALETRRAEGCPDGDGCTHQSEQEFLKQVLEDPRVDRELGATLPVRKAVPLAATLATYLHRDAEELGEAFGAWRDRLRPVVRSFLGLTSPASDSAATAAHDPPWQALRIAYILCDELALSDFIRASTLLADEVLRAENRDETPVRPVFEMDLDQLVPPGMGVAAEPDAALSDNPRRVRLAEPELVPVVIEVIWHGLGWLREPLLGWLRRLAGDQLERVRSRAAVIAGLLLRHDFDSVYRDLVRDWARSSSVRDRQNAALAMAAAMAADDPWLTERVNRQVADWATSPRRWLQDSAARAYGTPVGTRNVPATLQALQALGGRAALARYVSVAYAAAALFLTADGADPIADALGRWICADNDHLPRHAVRTLLVLGPYAVGPELPSRPKLVDLAMGDPRRRQALVLLWQRALIDPAHSGQAWQLVRQWLLAADEDEDLAVFLDEFMEQVCVPRLVSRARFHLGRWARQHPKASCVARILRRLGRE